MQFGVCAGTVLAVGSNEKGKGARQGVAPPAAGQGKYVPTSH